MDCMRASDPSSLTADLLELLDLQETESPSGRAFIAASDPHPGGHVFGGQVMAQAITAMSRTVPEQRRIHSTFGYFLEPAHADEPIRFEVEELRDGGSFSTRRATASQGERTIFSMSGSFQEPQEGFVHQEKAPSHVPAPHSLPTTADLLGHLDHPAAQYLAHHRPVDIRHVTAPLYYQADPNQESEQMVWMKALAPLTDHGIAPTSHIHDALLAFATDYTPFESMLRAQGLTWLSPGLKVATLNHAIWWHTHAPIDEWLLFVQRSPSAQGGRGLTTGHVFRENGALVATVTQEGMFRGQSTGPSPQLGGAPR